MIKNVFILFLLVIPTTNIIASQKFYPLAAEKDYIGDYRITYVLIQNVMNLYIESIEKRDCYKIERKLKNYLLEKRFPKIKKIKGRLLVINTGTMYCDYSGSIEFHDDHG